MFKVTDYAALTHIDTPPRRNKFDNHPENDMYLRLNP